MLDTKQQIQKIEKKFDLGFISEIQKEEKIEEIVVNSIIDSYFITGEVDYSLLRKYRKNIDFFTQFTSTSKSQYRIKKLNLNKILISNNDLTGKGNSTSSLFIITNAFIISFSFFNSS